MGSARAPPPRKLQGWAPTGLPMPHCSQDKHPGRTDQYAGLEYASPPVSCFARPVPRTSPWSDRRHPQRRPSWSTGRRPHAGLDSQGQLCSPPSRKVIFGSGGSLRHTQVVGLLLGQTLGRTSRTAVVTPPLRSTQVKVTSPTSTPEVPALRPGWRPSSFWRGIRCSVGDARSPIRHTLISVVGTSPCGLWPLVCAAEMPIR